MVAAAALFARLIKPLLSLHIYIAALKIPVQKMTVKNT